MTRRFVSGMLAGLSVLTALPASASATTSPQILLRRSVRDLTPGERGEFVAAIHALKAARSPFDPRFSYYDQFVEWHRALYRCTLGEDWALRMRAHGGPLFLPWHRLYLRLFERALQEVSGKPIAVPYWDWTDPEATAVVFSDRLLGGDGDPARGYAVTEGPFAADRWTLTVHPEGAVYTPSASNFITRRFGSFPPAPTLPTAAQVRDATSRARYDVAPWDSTADPAQSFRNVLEGFRGAPHPARAHCSPDGVALPESGATLHNGVHAWVAGLLGATPAGIRILGTMSLPTSPNDPAFWLHHANIDRLWARWQERHGAGSFEPSAGVPRNSLDDPLEPLAQAAGSFTPTARGVSWLAALGYGYADETANDPEASTLACRVPGKSPSPSRTVGRGGAGGRGTQSRP